MWKFIYFQASCIKEVDEKNRRLLFQIPNTFPAARVWVSMKMVNFENSVGNGYYRKLWYKDEFIFHGYELIDSYRHSLSVSAAALAKYCEPMDRHIRETLSSHREADLLRRKRYSERRKY